MNDNFLIGSLTQIPIETRRVVKRAILSVASLSNPVIAKATRLAPLRIGRVRPEADRLRTGPSTNQFTVSVIGCDVVAAPVLAVTVSV